jgi:Transposase
MKSKSQTLWGPHHTRACLGDWVSPRSVETSPKGGRAMAETRRKFDTDFREGAVRLVRETGKPIAQVARDLDINEGTRITKPSQRQPELFHWTGSGKEPALLSEFPNLVSHTRSDATSYRAIQGKS